MSGNEEIIEDMQYMIRRKFYIPDKERTRDYGRHEKLPADNILPCDYEEEDSDES